MATKRQIVKAAVAPKLASTAVKLPNVTKSAAPAVMGNQNSLVKREKKWMGTGPRSRKSILKNKIGKVLV